MIGVFRAQIKGSRNDKLDANGDHFAVSLKISTLNYYARIHEPIMLVFADLSEREDARECSVYWTWVTEDIRERLGSQSDFIDYEKGTCTFHVPFANRVTRDLDITAELRRFRTRTNALTQLCRNVTQVTQSKGALPDAISTISRAVEMRGQSLLSMLSATHESPWLEPEEGSIAAALRDTHNLLVQNDDNKAEDILDAESQRVLSDGTSAEQAEYEYLRGKICTLRQGTKEALDHFRQAVALNSNSSKYQATLIESQFCTSFPDDVAAIEKLHASISDSPDELILCVKARVQAALGDFSGALDLLGDRQSTKCLVARALIVYLQKDWQAVINQCNEGLNVANLKSSDRIIFHVLKARAYYYECLGEAASIDGAYISPFGNPTMDMEKAWLAWGEARTAFELLRKANWPSNAEHIVDVLSVLSVALNQQRSVIRDIADLSQSRQHLDVVHGALHRLAILSGDDQMAIDALDRMPDTDETLHLRILALYSCSRHEELLILGDERLLAADASNPMHGACLGSVALSAHSLLKPDRAKPFEKRLHDSPELAGDLAVYKFILSTNDNVLAHDAATQKFYEAYSSDPESTQIQDNLFPALNARNLDGASRCIEVAERIVKRRRLAFSEVKHLAQSHITLHDWAALLALADESIRQYGELPSLLTAKALAFEGMGDAAQALEILESIIRESPDEELAIESYADICIRNGFHEFALQQFEVLYQRADKSADKARYLRQMFSLEMAVTPGSPRLLDIAWKSGQICDQDDEEQEGLFLQMFVMSTLRQDIDVSEDRRKEFAERSECYFKKFPNSDVFKRVELPAELNASSLASTLNSVLGITPEAEKWFKRVENQMNRGELAAPYCWLPRRVLRNIPDVPYLWAIGKVSSRDTHAYHLSIFADPEQEWAELRRGLDRVPILDLTTLIVLQELGLLKIAFEILPRVAIGKRTLIDIQNLSHPFFGGYKQIHEISKFLGERVGQIAQPGLPTVQENDESNLDPSLEEIKSLVSTGRYTVYVDDERARQYINLDQDTAPCITTIQLLAEAERREILTTSQVSQKLSKLIDCRAIVTIKARYFLAAIPADVDGVDDAESLFDILTSDKTYSRMIAGLWDIRIPYERILEHVSYQVAFIAQSHRAKTELIAAVWETWLNKVRFRAAVEFTNEEHVGFALVSAAVNLKENPSAIKRLWDAYVLVVQSIHGAKMDKRVEMDARALVGRIAAGVAQKKEPKIRDAISKIMSSGLREGTEEFDAFTKAYEDERIRLDAKEQ